MDPAALQLFRNLCYAPPDRPTSFCPNEGLFNFAQTLRKQHAVLLMTLFIRVPHQQKRFLGAQGEEQFREAVITHFEHIVRIPLRNQHKLTRCPSAPAVVRSAQRQFSGESSSDEGRAS